MPRRHIFNVALEPVAGQRFQPTGFPDLGAGKFQKPVVLNDGTETWTDCILVESEQSMANHLEAVGWDRGTQKPVDALRGLPYVQVVNADGEYLTSSRTEAHRLSSAFIREALYNGGSFLDELRTRLALKDDSPLSGRAIAGALLALDPLNLVHGVFFADPKLQGQPKVTRALTSFVEAIDVRPAESGGVKRDDVRHNNADDGGSGEGYGSIPFHRTFWTARTIKASFVIDLAQIASYGLSAKASRLIEVIALWEIASLLDGGLRLRSMCDLVPTNLVVGLESASDPTFRLASATDLAAELSALTAELQPELANGAVLTVQWKGGSGGKKKDTPKPTES